MHLRAPSRRPSLSSPSSLGPPRLAGGSKHVYIRASSVAIGEPRQPPGPVCARWLDAAGLIGQLGNHADGAGRHCAGPRSDGTVEGAHTAMCAPAYNVLRPPDRKLETAVVSAA